MVFRPKGNFTGADLPEIQIEFNEVAATIDYDRINTRLFPTDAEVAHLKDLGFRIGGYNPNSRTVVGFSLAFSAGIIEQLCAKGTALVDPALNQLRVGIHEASHFFADNRFASEVRQIEKDAWARFPHEVTDSKKMLGIDQYTNLQTYFGEALADISAAIYLSNKYPNDPRVTEYLHNLPAIRTQNMRVGDPDYYHNSAALLMEYLKTMNSPVSSGKELGQNITIEQATRLSIDFIKGHLDLAVQDVNKIINMHKRNQWGSLSYRDLIDAGLMTKEDIEDVKGKIQKDKELSRQVCPAQ